MIKTETRKPVSDVLMKKMTDLVTDLHGQTTYEELIAIYQFWYHRVSNNQGEEIEAVRHDFWPISGSKLWDRIALLEGCGVDVGPQVKEIQWAYKTRKYNAEKCINPKQRTEELLTELSEILEECS